MFEILQRCSRLDFLATPSLGNAKKVFEQLAGPALVKYGAKAKKQPRTSHPPRSLNI
jgi:hypothetical protein